jgi:S-(hydroxymethyl)glutathione dehydrogenase/alcohol dehydrogenase
MVRAAVLEEVGGPLPVRDVSNVDPGAHQVLVRNLVSGICHTDQSLWNGGFLAPVPRVLGHEGVGVVEAVGPMVRELKVGDTVISVATPACGHCWFCIVGERHNCAHLVDLGKGAVFLDPSGGTIPGHAGLGTFSESMTVNEASVHKVETDLPAEQLALLGCAVTTGFGAVVNTARVHTGSSVVVIGCGGVGQSVVQAASVAGADVVIAVDPLDFKRDLAIKLGATHAIHPDRVDVIEAVKELTQGRGADYGFEVVGRPEAMLTAWQSTRMGGTATVIGMARADDVLSLSTREILLSRRTLIGSIHAGGDAGPLIDTIIRLVEQGRVKLGDFITERVTLDQVVEAFGWMESGKVLRSMITFD